MIHLGLIGYPIAHSMSPKIQAAALKACDLEGDYSLFPILPDDKAGLKELLSRVRSGEVTGLNVTIPHKQNVIEFMDDLMPTARSIGAVNTIYLRENKLIGDNTDAPGFLSDLKKFISTGELTVGKSALVLGAGGSARAVTYALMHNGWNVTLAARRIEQAQALVTSMHHAGLQVMDLSQDFLHASSFSLLVNTTPLGMVPEVDLSPIPEDACLPEHLLVYDLIYNPRETRLVREAHAQGLKATTGLGMLVEQAALGFQLWTGCNPPRDVLFKSVGE
jgi:shikimate dehydrogenase